MESLVSVQPGFWRNQRVLLTGHTGFKGGWLALWLRELGAETLGYSIDPPSQPSLFEAARLGEVVAGEHADIRDRDRLTRTVRDFAPTVVLHLAAQALVRPSYDNPVETFETNVLGTANVLEAVRAAGRPCIVVIVTSDKCYQNREWAWGYRENDPMGGSDPYSSSKGCAELVTEAYRRSFFGAANSGVAVASGRAGNVIGGGDWGRDRLVPDCVRAFAENKPAPIRNPTSVRPWQHVLEPLRGYLLVAERLAVAPERFARGWNFGPWPADVRSVHEVVDALCHHWGAGAGWESTAEPGGAEAHTLKLDCSLAHALLGWKPLLSLDDGLQWTAEWYQRHQAGEDAQDTTRRQIQRYQELCSGAS